MEDCTRQCSLWYSICIPPFFNLVSTQNSHCYATYRLRPNRMGYKIRNVNPFDARRLVCVSNKSQYSGNGRSRWPKFCRLIKNKNFTVFIFFFLFLWQNTIVEFSIILLIFKFIFYIFYNFFNELTPVVFVLELLIFHIFFFTSQLNISFYL